MEVGQEGGMPEKGKSCAQILSNHAHIAQRAGNSSCIYSLSTWYSMGYLDRVQWECRHWALHSIYQLQA